MRASPKFLNIYSKFKLKKDGKINFSSSGENNGVCN
jgi:hypothetical protein